MPSQVSALSSAEPDLEPDLEPPVDQNAQLPAAGALLAGRYRIESIHRAGGMGVVFRGRDERDGVAVAIKTVRQGCGRAALARFVLEASLPVPPHACLAQTRDRFVEGGRPYQVQDFVPGRSLAEILQARADGGSADGPEEADWFANGATLRTAVRAIAGVARGVAALHRAGIVHRDLKPANLVWNGASSRAVVVDFGLAVQAEGSPELTRAGAAVGTRGFMAPEQRRGGEVDPRTDVYGLGATLWAMLAEAPPAGPGAPPPSGIELPPALADILETALEPNPKRRFAGADELAEALEEWLAGRPGRRRPLGVLTVLRRWARRRRVGILVVSACVLLVTTVVLSRALWRARLDAASGRAALWGSLTAGAASSGVRVDDLLARRAECSEGNVELALHGLLAILREDPACAHPETRAARRKALRLLLATGRVEDASALLASLAPLDPAVDGFEDFVLLASLESWTEHPALAIEILERAAGSWPEQRALAQAAVRVLACCMRAVELAAGPSTVYRSAGGGAFPLLHDPVAGRIVTLDLVEGRELSQVSQAAMWRSSVVEGACAIRLGGGETGSLVVVLDGPVPGRIDRRRVVWLPPDRPDEPELVWELPESSAFTTRVGLQPVDFDGDGVDEAILPLSFTSGGAVVLRRAGGAWRVLPLPVTGNDIEALAVAGPAGDAPGRLWLGASLWNVGGQGYRLHGFEIDLLADGLRLRRRLALPLGAISHWGALRGWPASACASLSILDEARLFGRRFRAARSAEVWLLDVDANGASPREALWGTPMPDRFGSTGLVAANADLDADGRDEIYWIWLWGGTSGAAVAVTDGVQRLVLALPTSLGGLVTTLRDAESGREGLLGGPPGSTTALLVCGEAGAMPAPVPALPARDLARVVLVRSGAEALAGSFRIDPSWRPGAAGEWFEGRFRIQVAQFNSGGVLRFARDGGGEGDVGEVELSSQGGGGVQQHVLAGAGAGAGSRLELPAGAWVRLRLIPRADEATLDLEAILEAGAPEGVQAMVFAVGLPVVPGADYSWSWSPCQPEHGLEPRDSLAVLALDWEGCGEPRPIAAAAGSLAPAIERALATAEALRRAAESGDFAAFEDHRRALEALAGPCRDLAASEDERNGLAEYLLQSAPVWLVGGK